MNVIIIIICNTLIIIFSSNKDDIEVSIDQSKCTVLKAESTKIVCQTTAHLNSITAKVEVTIKGQGLANNVCIPLETLHMRTNIHKPKIIRLKYKICEKIILKR